MRFVAKARASVTARGRPRKGKVVNLGEMMSVIDRAEQTFRNSDYDESDGNDQDIYESKALLTR
jgi:hypothetical protein